MDELIALAKGQLGRINALCAQVHNAFVPTAKQKSLYGGGRRKAVKSERRHSGLTPYGCLA